MDKADGDMTTKEAQKAAMQGTPTKSAEFGSCNRNEEEKVADGLLVDVARKIQRGSKR